MENKGLNNAQIDLIEKLANKLNITAKEIFGFYLKQAKTYVVRFIIDLLVIIGITCFGYWLSELGHVEMTFKTVTLKTCIGAVIFFVGLFSLFIHLMSLSSVYSSITNPEYEATDDLLKSLFDN